MKFCLSKLRDGKICRILGRVSQCVTSNHEEALFLRILNARWQNISKCIRAIISEERRKHVPPRSFKAFRRAGFPNQLAGVEFPRVFSFATDTLQYLSSVSVPGLAFPALILHYINKGLKNQGCRGKRMAVVSGLALLGKHSPPSPGPFNLPSPPCFSPSGERGY